MPKKKNKKNKHPSLLEIVDNKSPKKTNNNEIKKTVKLIERVAEQVKTDILNERITEKISSLRAVNSTNSHNHSFYQPSNYLNKLKAREVGSGLQTKCTACRRRLFGDN